MLEQNNTKLKIRANKRKFLVQNPEIFLNCEVYENFVRQLALYIFTLSGYRLFIGLTWKCAVLWKVEFWSWSYWVQFMSCWFLNSKVHYNLYFRPYLGVYKWSLSTLGLIWVWNKKSINIRYDIEVQGEERSPEENLEFPIEKKF